MKEAFIVSAVRTAVGKAPKGTLRNTRADEMGAAVIKEAMARVPGLEAAEIEDVNHGLRDARSRARDEHRSLSRYSRGLAGVNQRDDHQSVLLVRSAVDCHRSRSDSDG